MLPNDLGLTNGDSKADGYDVFMVFKHEKDDPGFLIGAGLGHHEIHANISSGNDGIRFIPNYNQPYLDKSSSVKNTETILNARVQDGDGYLSLNGDHSDSINNSSFQVIMELSILEKIQYKCL